SGSINMLILGACFLVMGMYLGRPYCRFLCPYGALMRMLSRVSRWHATITPDECIECRLCEDSCPFGAINEPNAGESGQSRSEGKGRLAALIILVPVLAVAGGWLVGRAGPVMSRMHPTVRLSDRVWLEDEGEVSDLTDASENFRGSGRVAAELHEEAKEIKAQYGRGGRIFGALLGLLVSVKLISLAVRRKRTDYETDKAHCLSCGRCFSFCPMEHRRLKIIKGLIPKGPLPKKKQEDVL
ncbi:MAG: 4Fe-4S dicluster domain-containing protein, partial [Planctomycetia bacterium]|nr:4Fe-4S dicluster domain-containing protein [Planctomycetia bacterium]